MKLKNCFPVFGLGFLQPARTQFDVGFMFQKSWHTGKKHQHKKHFRTIYQVSMLSM